MAQLVYQVKLCKCLLGHSSHLLIHRADAALCYNSVNLTRVDAQIKPNVLINKTLLNNGLTLSEKKQK